MTPYAYTNNNPIMLVDPTGMASESYGPGPKGSWGGVKWLKYINNCSVDSVCVNPPYMKDTTAIKNPDLPMAIARHELLTDLETVINIASKLLKESGKFFMVHRPSRLSEIFASMRQNRIEPKRLRFIHPYIESKANLVLIEGAKGSGVWMDVEPPLVVYKDKNVYTDEVLKIYGR